MAEPTVVWYRRLDGTQGLPGPRYVVFCPRDGLALRTRRDGPVVCLECPMHGEVGRLEPIGADAAPEPERHDPAEDHEPGVPPAQCSGCQQALGAHRKAQAHRRVAVEAPR